MSEIAKLGGGLTSAVLQAGTFIVLYWLRLEHHIASPGSHPRLAFLLDSDWALLTTGSILSFAVCTLVAYPSTEAQGVSRGGRWLRATRGGLGITILVGILVLPCAMLVALNLWGS